MSSKCSAVTCFKTIAFIDGRKQYPCPFCNNSFYCSIDCRILDWEASHKKTCLHAPPTSSPDASPTSSPLNLSSGIIDSTKQKCIDDYEPVNVKNKMTSELGKGAFGLVKLVRDKSNPTQLYALKIIKKMHLVSSNEKDQLTREINIQKKLDHPHLIRLYHSFEDKDNVYLVLEYAENGNLFFYLHKKKKLAEKEAFVYFFQTCLGLDYLHKKGMLHRDLKPENLLLTEKGNVKLCDFGFSAEDVGTRNTFCGTVDYMAPEIVENKSYDYKVDIWSLGVLLFELTHGHAPFKGLSNNEKFKSIVKNQFRFEGISSEAQDLITQLLKSKPQDRPEFHMIFEHPWLKKFERELNMNLKSFIYKPSLKKGDSSPSKSSAIGDNLTFTKKEEIIKASDIYKPSPTPLNIEELYKVPISTAFSTTPQGFSKDELVYKTYTSQPISPLATGPKTDYKDFLKTLDLSYNTSTQVTSTTPTQKSYTDISEILNLTPKKQEISSPFSQKQGEISQQLSKTSDLYLDKFTSYGLKEDKKETGAPLSPYTSYTSTHLPTQIDRPKTPEKQVNLITSNTFSSTSYLNYSTADLLSNKNIGLTVPQSTAIGLGLDKAKEDKTLLANYQSYTQYTTSGIKETPPLVDISASLKSPLNKSYASDQSSQKMVEELAKLNNQAEKALAAATKFEVKIYDPLKEKATPAVYNLNTTSTSPLSKMIDENKYEKPQALSKSYTDLDQINSTKDATEKIKTNITEYQTYGGYGPLRGESTSAKPLSKSYIDLSQTISSSGVGNIEKQKTVQTIPSTHTNLTEIKANGTYDHLKEITTSPYNLKSTNSLSNVVEENKYTKAQPLSKSYTDLDQIHNTSDDTDKRKTVQVIPSSQNIVENKTYGTYEPVKDLSKDANSYHLKSLSPLPGVVDGNNYTQYQALQKSQLDLNQVNTSSSNTEKLKSVQTVSSTYTLTENKTYGTYEPFKEKTTPTDYNSMSPSPLPKLIDENKSSKPQALSKSYTDLDQINTSDNTDKRRTVQVMPSSQNIVESKTYGTYEPVKDLSKDTNSYHLKSLSPLPGVVAGNNYAQYQALQKSQLDLNQVNTSSVNPEKQKTVQTTPTSSNITEVVQKPYINIEENTTPLPIIDNSQKNNLPNYQAPQQAGGRKNRLLQQVKQAVYTDTEVTNKETQEHSPQATSPDHALYVDLPKESFGPIAGHEDFTFAEDSMFDPDIQIKETFGMQQLMEIQQNRVLTSQLETITKSNPTAVMQDTKRILPVEVKKQAAEPKVDQNYKLQAEMEREREIAKREMTSHTSTTNSNTYKSNTSDNKHIHNQHLNNNTEGLSPQSPNFNLPIQPIASSEKKKVNIVFENTQMSDHASFETKQEHQTPEYKNKRPTEFIEDNDVGQYSQQGFHHQYTPSSQANKDLLIQTLLHNESAKSHQRSQSSGHHFIDRSNYREENNTVGQREHKMFSPYQTDRDNLLKDYRDKLTDYYHLGNTHQNELPLKSRNESNDQFYNDHLDRDNHYSRQEKQANLNSHHQKSTSYHQNSPHGPYPNQYDEHETERRTQRKNQAAEMLWDSDEGESEKISRPSLKNAREIRQYQVKPQQAELGLFAKLSLFCGWNPRKEDQKPKRKSKGRHTGY